ncbi:MAG: hypothetical protein ACFHX7_22075 [Pseudomonadota bacterium]
MEASPDHNSASTRATHGKSQLALHLDAGGTLRVGALEIEPGEAGRLLAAREANEILVIVDPGVSAERLLRLFDALSTSGYPVSTRLGD